MFKVLNLSRIETLKKACVGFQDNVKMEKSIGERVFLIPKQKPSLLQRIKLLWKKSNTEPKMVVSLLILLSLAISLICINFKSSTKDFNQVFYEKGINMTALDPLDRRFLLMELASQNSKASNIIELLTLLQQNKPWEKKKESLESSERHIDFETLTMCSLLLESLKQMIHKCMNTDVLPKKCQKLIQKKIHCAPLSKYRTTDGSCNNLDNPDWGMHGSSNRRWLPAAFSNDVSSPRKSETGRPLPGARHLSSTLFSRKTRPDSNITMLFTHFGLFLVHDLLRAGPNKGNKLECCGKDYDSPDCYSIDVASDDYFYGSFNISCLAFLRSRPTIGECPGRREQMNLMTSFIDLSDIYGPTEKKFVELRSFNNGKLRTSKFNNTVLLPVTESLGNSCYTSHSHHMCFSSGDIRTNMLSPLMILHTLWAREHNRLAVELKRINPNWNDEKLFQEARRINNAELQYITYKGILPLIFGHRRMKEYGLLIEEDEVYNGYNATQDPTIRSAFLTAAFRFGHALVQGTMSVVDENYKNHMEVPLYETYMNPDVLYDHNLDSVIRGMVSQKAQQVEPFTTEGIRGHLLQKFYSTHGLDLTAITIQRGRDHGLPPYLEWRKYCNLSNPVSWADLKEILAEEYVEQLKMFYASVEDIDLMVGALGEKHPEEALVGPTYLCLLGKQFRALREGDRFWFENPNQPGSFTRDQLKELYKTSIAKFLCNTSDNLKTISLNSFVKISEKNPIVSCGDLHQMDLSLWKEN